MNYYLKDYRYESPDLLIQLQKLPAQRPELAFSGVHHFVSIQTEKYGPEKRSELHSRSTINTLQIRVNKAHRECRAVVECDKAGGVPDYRVFIQPPFRSEAPVSVTNGLTSTSHCCLFHSSIMLQTLATMDVLRSD
ncbi:hypothetical protein MHYP_G00020780 [Metynnis hypsauchen]